MPFARCSTIHTTSWPHELTPFRPPWWLAGGHAQTVAAALWSGPLPEYAAIPRPVSLPDGDVVIVHDDCPPAWQPGQRAVLLMHGLAGCHRSPLLVRLAARFSGRGVRVFRLDMRCCGAGLGLARFPYHGGRSEDVAEVVQAILRWCATSPSSLPAAEAPPPRLALVGISLSGNILLKYLGEAPERVPAAVMQAVAINPPIDLAECVDNLSGFINRWYDRHFVRVLERHLRDHCRQRPDAPLPNGPRKLRRLNDFDNWYTAPVSGFGDAATYYARASAAPLIPHIQTPTLILSSLDDPLVPAALFLNRSATWPETVRLTMVPGGGHVGYLARPGLDPDMYWLEWRLLDLILGGSGRLAA